MTLITVVAGIDWLAIAADRRLTWNNDPSRTKDIDNKVAILHGGKIMVGYAGDVSWLPDHTRFEDWVLSVTKVAPSRQMHVLREALQAVWRDNFTGNGPALGVIGVGYKPGDGYRHPFITAVSNAVGQNLDFNPHRVMDRFRVRSSMVKVGHLAIATMGFGPEPADQQVLGDSLVPLSGPLTLQSVSRLRESLVDFHLATAELANGVVGTQTMIVTVPFGAWPASFVRVELQADGVGDYAQTPVAYTYNDPSARRIQQRPFFAPAIESRGFQTSGVEIRLGSTEEIGPPVNLREVSW
ncbi:hypothetical protein [Leifsonia sp. EB34]|uniref:hypothetical protein n=1 Tax=Leifsonia sp. EB34 TaxID=3156303 RepID=UPI003517DE53